MDAHALAALGRDLHTRLRTFFDTPLGPDATPLELAQAVLDDVERHVQPVGRGRRVFPYTTLAVRVLARESTRAPMEAAFENFGVRVRDRLAELRCEPRDVLDIEVTCVTEAPEAWATGQLFEARYVRAPEEARARTASARPAAAAPVLHVTVVKGTATEGVYSFSEATVSIGRSADTTDGLGRMRRNRIAFLDVADGVNETVGRAHARLRFDAGTGDYLLFDDGSSNGTSILRDGDLIAVHRRDPRGVRVRSGDEIQIGRAVVRVEIDT